MMKPVSDFLCAKLAASSYGNECCPSGATPSTCWNVAGLHVEVTYDQNNVYVTFRGTDEARDWLTNLNIKLVEVVPKGAMIHRGFLSGVLRVVSVRGFIPTVKRLSVARRVVCVGHSLGGALAEVFAYWLLQKDWFTGSVAVRKFGAPRVGNKAYARYMTEAVPDNINHAHVMDPVTWQPSAGWRTAFREGCSWWRYRHAGTVKRYWGFASPLKAHSSIEYLKRVS